MRLNTKFRTGSVVLDILGTFVFLYLAMFSTGWWQTFAAILLLLDCAFNVVVMEKYRVIIHAALAATREEE